ncbi:MAG: hypothetical protein INQ03_04555 [Candidatus Heimdallarchaeota archaeon]|nr:hypothetical protein [Candidatus Heimdallarchaeota archaeon]
MATLDLIQVSIYLGCSILLIALSLIIQNQIKVNDGNPNSIWYTVDVYQTIRFSYFYLTVMHILVSLAFIFLPMLLVAIIMTIAFIIFIVINIFVVIVGLFMLLFGDFPNLFGVSMFDYILNLGLDLEEEWLMADLGEIYLQTVFIIVAGFIAGYLLAMYIEEKKTAILSLINYILTFSGVILFSFIVESIFISFLEGHHVLSQDESLNVIVAGVGSLLFAFIGIEVAFKRRKEDDFTLIEILHLGRIILIATQAIAYVSVLLFCIELLFDASEIILYPLTQGPQIDNYMEHIILLISLFLSAIYAIFKSVALIFHGIRGDLDHNIKLDFLEGILDRGKYEFGFEEEEEGEEPKPSIFEKLQLFA